MNGEIEYGVHISVAASCQRYWLGARIFLEDVRGFLLKYY